VQLKQVTSIAPASHAQGINRERSKLSRNQVNIQY